MNSAKGWDHSADLARLVRLERAEPESVERERKELLAGLLLHCSREVPYYRALFRERGLDPKALAHGPDLSALPVVDKSMLRSRYADFLVASGERPRDRWKSSGSTGEPFAFYVDRRTIAANQFATLERARGWWGLEVGSPELMIWSGVRDVSGTLPGRYAALKRRLSWRLKNIRLIDVYQLDEDVVRSVWLELLRFGPCSIRGIASGVVRFCEALEARGLDGHELGLRGVIYTGEGLTRPQRKRIEEVLGCPTISEFGCTELGIMAFECPEGGLHLNHENFVFEYLKDGRPAPMGEAAELVVTNLMGWSAPLIRYRVGDMVVPTEEACPCGRTMPVVASLEGRVHDSIRTPEGTVVHGLFFTHLFDRMSSVERFRIVQPRTAELAVELYARQPIPKADREWLANAINQEMGPRVTVRIAQVDRIPVAPSGKTPWIVSEAESDA